MQKFNFGYYFLLGTGLVSFILFLNFEGTREEKKREREEQRVLLLALLLLLSLFVFLGLFGFSLATASS